MAHVSVLQAGFRLIILMFELLKQRHRCGQLTQSLSKHVYGHLAHCSSGVTDIA